MSHLCSGASSIRGVRDRVERIASLSRRKFRVRYDRIVSFDPYDDGFGIMRDAQTAKPQTFRTGDSRFTHNLAANLDQVPGWQPASPNIPPLPHRETSLHHREGRIRHPRPQNTRPFSALQPGKKVGRSGRKSQVCKRTAPTATSTRLPKRDRRPTHSRAGSTWSSGPAERKGG